MLSVSEGKDPPKPSRIMPIFCYSGRVKNRIDSNRKAWWIQTMQPSLRVAMEIWFNQILFQLWTINRACWLPDTRLRHEKEMTAFHRRHSVSLKLTMSLKAPCLTVWKHLNKTIRVHLLKWYNMHPEWWTALTPSNLSLIHQMRVKRCLKRTFLLDRMM